MKTLIVKMGVWGLNLLYSLMKMLPVRKKIVYLSRQQNTPPLDFVLIREEMEKLYPEYENVYLVKMVPDGILAKIGYCFFILKQMYHIATAQAAILDTYSIPICLLKQRETLKVIQIWHALGAFKKFSFSILDQPEGRSSKTARLMHMHENYTYVLTSSRFCSPFFQEAFGASENQMRVIPLPRVDYICDPQVRKELRNRILDTYPQLKDSGKKILVYAPTFRKYEVDFNRAVEELVAGLDFDRYQLIVKLHPLSDVMITNPKVIVDKSFVTHEIFQVADAVIADYSAVIFEAALLGIPLYFYAFDLDQYASKRDFYLDYESDMPGPIRENANDLIRSIEAEEGSEQTVREFCDRMIERNDRSSAARITDLIMEGTKSETDKTKQKLSVS